MKSSPHTSCKKGKKVVVILRSGFRILDKFVEKRSKGVILKKRGFVPTKNIRAFSIYRGQHDE
jgi:hypothetical protein